MYDYEERINQAVFPGLQGGPHNHTIAALAVALKQAQQPEFKEYAQQVVRNSRRLSETLVKLGYTVSPHYLTLCLFAVLSGSCRARALAGRSCRAALTTTSWLWTCGRST
jgi:glycine/serine hydroxymethyltransferase